MFKYIVKRVLISILILLGVSVIVYTLVRLMPLDFIDKQFAAHLGNGTVSDDDIIRIKEIYGLSDNSFFGIMKGYFNWLLNMLKGDFGSSFKYGEPVMKVIFDSMWISFSIALIALIFQFAIAIPLGIKSATNQYGKVDYTVTVITMMGLALPSYFVAALFMKIFSIELGWFPLQGLVDATTDWSGNPVGAFFDKLWHLIMPMTIFIILGIGSLMRYTRTNMLEVMSADYIRTARAKGLSERLVVYKHGFRNTMIPLVTMMAGILPSLFSGAMIIETVFAIPGIGQLAYKATVEADIPFIMGYNMFLALLTVTGTLLSDLMYGLVDPRVKLAK